MKRGFSRGIITPGVTTPEDLRWYYWQTTTDLGLPVSFPAFYRRHRSNRDRQIWGDEDRVIRPGNLLHCDVGFKYMRLLTDHQEMAYVLRPGETEPPEGLRNEIRQANQLQDIFTSTWAEGLSGNEILARALTLRPRRGHLQAENLLAFALVLPARAGSADGAAVGSRRSVPVAVTCGCTTTRSTPSNSA